MRIGCSGNRERQIASHATFGCRQVVADEYRRRRLQSNGRGDTMHRRIMIPVLALLVWSGTVGSAVFDQWSPTSVAPPPAAQRLAPKVARLAQELGVSLDARAAIDPLRDLQRLYVHPRALGECRLPDVRRDHGHADRDLVDEPLRRGRLQPVGAERVKRRDPHRPDEYQSGEWNRELRGVRDDHGGRNLRGPVDRRC